ncbi:MAG: endo-1,4-beta-xylanase, partial [Phycisphaeraceae bacterium JB051]
MFNRICIIILLVAGSTALAQNHPVANSPWGIASGADSTGLYIRYNPMLRDAGVTWVRYFPEWQTIQPAKGKWNWKSADDLIANARSNQIQMSGFLAYFAKWSSSQPNNTRRFPVKDMNDWRTYVRQVVGRYKDDIQYWEVWNEPNSPAFNKGGTPSDYAAMVRAAYEQAKQVNPNAKIGIGVAAFDLHWLDQVIKAGAADHFDYLCVHPYNNIGLVFGSEKSYLAMAQNTRDMLAANGQRDDIELWMSEIGLTTTTDPQQQQRQANALIRAYVLGIAQGFDRICWFEAVGPHYGKGVHAIIDNQFQPYQAYTAFKTMTTALGPVPTYLGWLDMGNNVPGFVFETARQPVLVTWANEQSVDVRFESKVTVTDDTGSITTLNAGDQLALTKRPVFINNLPKSLIKAASSNKSKPYTWTPDYSSDQTVSVQLGPVNQSRGIRQGNNDPRTDGLTIAGTFNGQGYRSTDLANKRPFIYFEVDPSFMGWNDQEVEITVVARRAVPDQPAKMLLVYESQTGYHEYAKRTTVPGLNVELMVESDTHRTPEYWYLEPGEHWQQYTWRVKDACFIGKWGWHFQINVEPSSGDIWVKQVHIKKNT